MTDLFALLAARALGEAPLLRVRPRGMFEDGAAEVTIDAARPSPPETTEAAPPLPSESVEPAPRPIPQLPTQARPPPAASAPATRIAVSASPPVLARRFAPGLAVPTPLAPAMAPRRDAAPLAAWVAGSSAPLGTTPLPATRPALPPSERLRPIDDIGPPRPPPVAAIDAPASPRSAVAPPFHTPAPAPLASRLPRMQAPPTPAAAVPPEIRIEIGRIEIRNPPAPAAPAPRASGLMPLDRYLRRDPPR